MILLFAASAMAADNEWFVRRGNSRPRAGAGNFGTATRGKFHQHRRFANPQRHTNIEIPIICKTIVTAANWQTIYEAKLTNQMETLMVIHAAGQSNIYFYNPTNFTEQVPGWETFHCSAIFFSSRQISGAATDVPFRRFRFLVADLGLEFFHWPEQKVLKKEVRRSRGCTVLESTNPDPSTNGYSRVVSWIDNETLGIVEAYAYDAKGKLLKDFYPKDFKKVNGQWQVQTLVMENVQTGSRSRLEFDLKKK